MPTLQLEAAAIAADSDSEGERYRCVEPAVTKPDCSRHITADHVHGQGFRWRKPFDEKLISRFSTYIYGFTWEDPRVDLEFLNLTPQDRMLVITSGGCNVLEYAAKVGPGR